MLYHFLFSLRDQISAFNIFGYITFRAVIAFVIAFLTSLLLFPRFIKMMNNMRLKQVIRDEGPESHKIKIGTPTMGGVMIIISIVIALIFASNYHNSYTWIVLFATVSFGIVGFIDDFLKVFKKTSDGMHGKVKMILQTFIAIIISSVVYFTFDETLRVISIPFVKNLAISMPWYIYIPFGTFIIVASSNAVNLTDGLDGLAAGLMIAAIGSYGFFCYISGHIEFAKYFYLNYLPISSELLVYCLAMIGGLCGFLWFNAHPAQIFMGDVGSLTCGGMLGTIALVIKQELLLAIIGGVFVAEAMSVIIQVTSYKLFKKRVFLMSPLHHHFELKGWAESKVITRFWLIGGMLAILALGSLKLR